MGIKSIKQIDQIAGKTVLVRADFNVPVKNGRVLDVYKIKRSLPTIKYLLKQKARVVIVSHLGRPKGFDKSLSLKPVKKELEKLLRIKVDFSTVQDFCSVKHRSPVILLENIRFIEGQASDKKVAKMLANLADAFVLDGFAVSHRESPSVSGVAKYLPAYAGFLLEGELKGLDKLLHNPKRPYVAVLGGAKMETKIPVLKNLLKKADRVLIGGALFNTYLLSQGFKIGASLADAKYQRQARKYFSHKKVVLPLDVIIGPADGKGAKAAEVDEDFCVKGKKTGIFDIGVKTIREYAKYIKSAQTLVWNGAMGYFEQHPYEYGTRGIARLVASRSKGKAFGVCGGGETVEVLKKMGLLGYIDLASTGGGAMLEYLFGKELPGIKSLKKQNLTFKRILHSCIAKFKRGK